MAMSRTAWTVTALGVAATVGTTSFVLANAGTGAPSAPATFAIEQSAEEESTTGGAFIPTTPGSPTTADFPTTPAFVDTPVGSGPADLPPGIPFIDTSTCDAWFEDWDDTVPDRVEDYYDDWDDRCDDLHDDWDDDDWDDDDWDDDDDD